MDRKTASESIVGSAMLSHCAISISDEDGTICYVNDLFCEWCGYSRERMVGENHRVLNSGHHSGEFWKQMWRCIRKGEPWSAPVCNRNAEGRDYWVHLTVNPIHEPESKVKYLSVSTRIPEPQETISGSEKGRSASGERDTRQEGRAGAPVFVNEEQMQENGLFKGMLDAATGFSIIATDTEGIITHFNRGAEILLGYRAEEVVSRCSPERFHLESEIKERARELTEKLGIQIEGFDTFVAFLREETGEERQWTYVRKDGSYVQVLLVVTPLKNAEGDLTGYLGVARDISKRIEVIEALRDSETRFRGAFEQSGIGMAIVALDGSWIQVNPSICQLFGYDEDELLALKFQDITHPDDLKADMDLLEETLRGERDHYRMEKRYFHRTGKIIWAKLTVSLIKDRSGRPDYFVSQVEDITPLKESDSALRESEHLKSVFIESVPVSVAMLDRELRYIQASGTWLKYFELEHEQILGKVLPDLHPQLAKHWNQAFNMIGEEGVGEFSGESLITRSEEQNSLISWNMVPWKEDDGGVGGIVVFCRDITMERELEDKLANLNHRLSLATKAGGVGIWDWDIRGDSLVWDEEMYSLYGISREQFDSVFESWQNGLYPEDSERATEEIQKALSGEKEFNTQFRVRRPDGEIRHLRALGTVERDPSGNPVRMIGTNWDITEWVKYEEKLKNYAAESNQASKAKSQFLANMSHEIRTPMNGVLGMASLLTERDDLPDEVRDYIEVIQSSAEALMDLINDILDFSKVEAGHVQLDDHKFSLHKALDDYSSILIGKAAERNLDFFYRIEENVPDMIIGDSSKLRQILLNLGGNAIKFTEKGKVETRVELVEKTESSCMLKFSVIDTGIGIREEARAHIFEEFSQADGSTTRLYGGTGLGLAISRRLSELMGGEIGVESELNSGSTFWFTASFRISSESRIRQFEGKRVMTLIPDRERRERVTRWLVDHRVEVKSLVDPFEALEVLENARLKNNAYDLVLINAEIPGLSLRAFLDRLQERVSTNYTGVIPILERNQSIAELDVHCYSKSGILRFPFREPEWDRILEKRWSTKDEKSGMPASDSAKQKANPVIPANLPVLVAEDNPVNQMVSEKLLSKLGLEVELVENGYEVIRQLKHRNYAMVLMDVQMPEMDGLTACELVRRGEAGEQNRRIPIVALTAHAREEDRMECLRVGMNDYLSKPLDRERLKVVLEQYIFPKKD